MNVDSLDDLRAMVRQHLGPDFPVRPAFVAMLPRSANPVRITSLHRAGVYLRRWMIRDRNKDREIRKLHDRLRAVVSEQQMPIAMAELRAFVASRDLLPKESTLH